MIVIQENTIFNNHEKIEFKTVKLTTISDRGCNARGYVAACNGAGKIPPVPAVARLAIICYVPDSNTLEYKCNLGAHDLPDRRFESQSRRQLVMARYGKQGLDSHVQSEHGCILNFVDKRANSLKRRSFDFSQSSRKFVQPIDQRPPDANVNPQ